MHREQLCGALLGKYCWNNGVYPRPADTLQKCVSLLFTRNTNAVLSNLAAL